MDRSIATELFRRRSGQVPSLAGMQGGNLQQNPINPAMQAPGQAPQPPSTASGPGREQLQNSQPGEAELIIKALTKRLSDLPPYKPQTQPGV